MNARAEVIRRSYGMCEAMVRLPRAYARCGRSPVDVHHALKRSRGGHLLDVVGETYHLIALCRSCHMAAEAENDWEAGLILHGYVSTDSTTGWPIYTGPDPYLTATYPNTERERFSPAVGAEPVPRLDGVRDPALESGQG